MNPVGSGEAVVISMTYKSVIRLLQTLPILSQRKPRTSKLNSSVSNPRLILGKVEKNTNRVTKSITLQTPRIYNDP